MSQPQPLSQQAVFIANSESFRRFVDRCEGLLDRTTTPKSAGLFIKHYCGVRSRKEFDSDPEKAAAFLQLLSRYRRYIAEHDLPEDENSKLAREVAA